MSASTPLTHSFANPKLAAEARQKLARLREKAATIGGDQETSFEQAFASLAYTYIRDKAPKLIDFMVGFQLVDRNDDNTKAVGVFGFKVGNMWAYAPVFFLNGDLKGHELLYLKEQDMFVPMKENWLNYIMAKRPHVLGEPEGQTQSDLGIIQPDIRNLSIPPHNRKYGSATDGWRDCAVGFAPMFGALIHGDGSAAFEKFGSFDASQVLQRVLRSHVDLCKMAFDVCQQYPAIGKAFDEIHGSDCIKNALLDLRDTTEKAAKRKEFLPDLLSKDRPSQLHMAMSKRASVLGAFTGEQPVKYAAGPPVSITVDEDETISETGEPLTEAERERLLRDGHLIKDHREGDEISRRYNVQQEMELTNPDASGLYQVLVKPGDFTKCLLVANAHSGCGRKDFATVVRLDPRDWLNGHRTSLWVKPNTSTVEDFQKWYDDLFDKESLEKGGTYLLLTRNGEGSVPFRVREKMSAKGSYSVSFLDWADRKRPTYLPSAERYDRGYPSDIEDGGCGRDMVCLSDREGVRMKSMQGTLYAPEACKVIVLKKPVVPKKKKNDDDAECGCCPEMPESFTQSEDNPFEPGNMADLQMQILQKTARLKLHSDGSEVSINGSPLMAKRSGLFSLVRDWGLREKEARTMLKEAETARLRGSSAIFQIKLADQYSQTVGPGPTAPPVPDPQIRYEDAYGRVPTQYTEDYDLRIDEMSSNRTDPEVYNPLPEATPDPMAMQTAQQAASLGQKEVFDTAMISGLLKSVRQDSLVDRHMGDLLTALDRLGRLLFLFYWHNDEFTDRYGKADMPELEDTLRNAFEVLGDLVLFLKEKDVEPLPGTDMGRPEIEEAANS